MYDLTGTWTSGDSLTYQFTQIGNTLLTKGDNGRGWMNVGSGYIEPDTNQIIMHWGDTPDSKGFGAKGVLFMEIKDQDHIEKKGGSANFGIGNFTRALK